MLEQFEDLLVRTLLLAACMSFVSDNPNQETRLKVWAGLREAAHVNLWKGRMFSVSSRLRILILDM